MGFSGYVGKDGHGHAGTDTRARTRGHGQTDSFDGQLWKRRAEKLEIMLKKWTFPALDKILKKIEIGKNITTA